MAIIRNFDVRHQNKERDQSECGAALVLLDLNGEKFVQLMGYGSPDRINVGARSQNMRLTKAAFEQLVKLGRAHFSKSN